MVYNRLATTTGSPFGSIIVLGYSEHKLVAGDGIVYLVVVGMGGGGGGGVFGWNLSGKKLNPKKNQKII